MAGGRFSAWREAAAVNGRLAFLSVLCIAGFTVCMLHATPPSGWLWSVLAVAAVWAEVAAARVPGAGRVTVAFAPLLALAMTPGGGPALAALVATFSLVLRGALGGHPDPPVRALETLQDLASHLVPIALVSVWPQPLALVALLSVLTYMMCSSLLSELLAAELPDGMAVRFRKIQVPDLVLPRLACCCVGLAAGHWSASQPATLLLLLPMLGLIRHAAGQVLQLEEQDQHNNLVRRLDQSRSALVQASEQQQQLQKALHQSHDEFRVLETASRAMLRVSTRRASAEEIVRLCASLVPCQSVAVFGAQPGNWDTWSASTPHGERIGNASLMGLEEAVVEKVRERGAPQWGTQPTSEQRVFPDETEAVALPLGGTAVLYVGRVGQPFSELERRYLGQAMSLGALGFEVATQLEKLDRALQQQTWLSEQARQSADALNALLHQSLGFLDKFDPAVLTERLEAATAAIFPHDSLEVNLSGTHPLQACRMVAQTRTPLLLEDVATTPFPPHRPGQRSLLCVPIAHPELPRVGIIVLGANAPGFYGRSHQNLLSLLANVAAVAWKNAELTVETQGAQAQLIQSSKMAAVGQLAAGVAHELNTPLASIRLNLEMGVRLAGSRPEQVAPRLEKAMEMVARSQEIVGKLLYYSREATKGQRVTDLNNLMRDTVELIGKPLTAEGVTLECHEFAGSAHAMVNQNEIQQVLFNLLLNAKDAVRGLAEERRRLVVRVFAEGDQTGVRVQDRGHGIKPADGERIFEPFYTTKAVGSGTGLGLSISSEIATAHGGSLSFTSAEGQGTEFCLALPRVEAPPPAS